MKFPTPHINFNLNNIKVSYRLIISFALLIMLMLIVGTFGALTIRSTQEGSIIQGYIENVISDVRVVNEHNIAYRFDRNDYRPDIIREKSVLAVEDLEKLKPYVPQMLIARFDSAFSDTKSLIELSRQILHQGLHKNLSNIDTAYQKIIMLADSRSFPPQLDSILSDFGQTMDLYKASLEHTGWVNWKIENVSFSAVSNMDIISERFKNYLTAELKQNIIIIITTIIFSLLFATAIAFLIIRSINGGFREAISIAGQIAKGDLTLTRINNSQNRNDEFGKLRAEFSLMLNSLRSNVNSLLEMSSVMENTGDALYKSAQEISNNANEQRYKSEQIINALQNLNDLSQVNATQSEELSASSEQLKEYAIELKKQVDFFTL